MNSAVLFLSVLLALSAASAVVYEEELQFDAMGKMPKEMSPAIVWFQDYIKTLPYSSFNF